MACFDPPVSRAAQWFAAVQFVVLLAGALGLLWFAERAERAEPLALALGSATLVAGYWAIGAVLQGSIRWPKVLLMEVIVLAAAVSALMLANMGRSRQSGTLINCYLI